MHALGVVLVCLVGACRALELKNPRGEVGNSESVKELATLLLASSPTAAWQGQGVGKMARSRSPGVPAMQEKLYNVHPEAKELAMKLNPVVGYYDPLNLAAANFWGKGNDFTWGWLRHAEIKHGRVAMAAFVGYIVQASGFHWPFALQGGGVEQATYAAGLSPPEQWDALSLQGKLQIILFVGFLEFWSELQPEKHYTKGGKPGYFPPFEPEAGLSMKQSFHPQWWPPRTKGRALLDLYDPFGYSKNRSEEEKARGLCVEINNGRLAMLGIFGFLAEAKVPGAVPALAGLIKPYAGEVMAPFSS